jgi:hypothetical protein
MIEFTHFVLVQMMNVSSSDDAGKVPLPLARR